MEAYITTANFKCIANSIKLNEKIAKDILITNIASEFIEDDLNENDINDFFNTPELEQFYKMKMFLQNIERLEDEINKNRDFLKQYIKQQNIKYKYSVKMPAYHCNKDCSAMHSDFYNEIKDTQEKITLKNSGSTYIHTMEDFNFKIKISEQKRQMIMLLNSNIAKFIADYKYAPAYATNNIKQKKIKTQIEESIIDFHTAKDEMKKIMTYKYQNKYNKYLEFNQHLLDIIGFRKCSTCHTITVGAQSVA